MHNYPFDETELRRRFPQDVPMPPLLIAWGKWMAKQPSESIGDIGINTEYPDDIVGPEYHAQIIKFMTGLRFDVYFWRHDGANVTNLPVMARNDEGLVFASPSLTAFIARIATGYFEQEETYCDNLIPERVHFLESRRDDEAFLDPDEVADFRRESKAMLKDKPPDRRGALGAWLLAQTGADRLEDLINVGPPLPAEPMIGSDSWALALDENASVNPTRVGEDHIKAISDLMSGDFAIIIWVGDYYRAVVGKKGIYVPPFRDLPEAEAIKPHVAALRDAWAQAYPGVGLWHSATFEKSGFMGKMASLVDSYMDDRNIFQKISDGLNGNKRATVSDAFESQNFPELSFSPNYDTIYPLELGEDLPSSASFNADHARVPRAPHRISKWLQERLSNE